LQWVSLNQLLLLLAITLFSAGWMLIQFLGRRKAALDKQDSPPSIPIRLPILTLIFLTVLFMTVAKFLDSQSSRATVLPKMVEVRAGPDPEQATLFEVYEGLEVLVDDIQNNWAKITYPGGRSGWVPFDTLSLTK
jgi:hypothetical protein